MNARLKSKVMSQLNALETRVAALEAQVPILALGSGTLVREALKSHDSLPSHSDFDVLRDRNRCFRKCKICGRRKKYE